MSTGRPLVPLDRLPGGARARVRALRAEDEQALHALTGLGLLPGVRLVVLRRSPVLCIRVDGACYAVDRALARGILVEADTPPATSSDGGGAGGLRS